MNNYRNIMIVFCFFFFLQGGDVFAQNAKANKKTAPITITTRIVDGAGNPVSGAVVHSSKKRTTMDTDIDGKITFTTNVGDVLVIKADGYEPKRFVLSAVSQTPDTIALSQRPLFSGEENQLFTPFGKTTERRTVGAYSIVKGEELESTPSMSIESALGGRLNGLFQLQNTLVPGWTNHNLYVRGGWGNYITIVDGVERTLEYLEPEVIESVELLKDATLKSLYGGLQANGILLITTKKGKAYENSVRVNVEHGIQTPSRLPEYLNSYDYATYYNQALENDNFEPMYDQAALNANKDHSSPILYPDVDHYSQFLNKSFNMSRINTQLRGGDDKARYFAHLGYQGSGGLEKHTSYPNSDDIFTVRTSVDLELRNFLTFNAGFNAALQNKEWPNLSTQDFFAPLASHHPNDYPILIPGEMVGRPESEYVFGGTVEKQNNPYGLLTENGYAERRYTYIQSDFGFNIDLDQWIKGLSIKPSVSFDIYNVETATKGASFAVYEPYQDVSSLTGNDTILFHQWGENTHSTSQSRSGAEVRRNFAFHLTSVYDRKFGQHDLYALLNFFQSKNEIRSVHESPRRQNLGFHLSDLIADKYLLEFNVNRVGVTSFSKENRYGYFPAFGLGWILSEESFLKKSEVVDYLKLRASYGILGSTTYTSTGGFSTHLYQDVWYANGTILFGGDDHRVSLDRTGNPDIGFQKSYEFNAGFDMLLFNRTTRLSMGYFNNINDGLIVTRADMVPGVTGHNEALPFWNYNKYGLEGFEGELSYYKKIGTFHMNISANATYGVTNRIIEAEPSYPQGAFSGLIIEGRPLDAILGFEAIGVFTDQNDIDGSPKQTFGPVRVGDIKYADKNNDGFVDERDREEIGNSSPRLQYGISLDLNYKGFNLNVLGIGYGKYNRLLDTPYYQIHGDRKYSQVVIDGLPNGNAHPQLSSKSIDNNFVSSDYWIVNSSFFKLRNVEFGYTLPQSMTEKLGISQAKVFTRGHNLMTFSKIKDLDPENLNAGVGNFPLCSTYTIGVSLSF